MRFITTFENNNGSFQLDIVGMWHLLEMYPRWKLLTPVSFSRFPCYPRRGLRRDCCSSGHLELPDLPPSSSPRASDLHQTLETGKAGDHFRSKSHWSSLRQHWRRYTPCGPCVTPWRQARPKHCDMCEGKGERAATAVHQAFWAVGYTGIRGLCHECCVTSLVYIL